MAPALANPANALCYDPDDYEYKTGCEVEQIMGSLFKKERKWVPYLVNCKGYPEEADWTEEPYDNFDDKRLLKQYYKRNPQATKDIRIG
jgi:hypothetical protein